MLRRSAASPWQGLLIGIASAVVIWAFVQAAHPIYRVSKEFDVPSIGAPTEKFLAHRAQQDRVDLKHAAIYLGALGSLLAGAIVLRERFSQGPWWASFCAAPLGALGGAFGGISGSLLLQFVRSNVGQADLQHLVEVQLVVASPLGLGVGLGVGLMMRSISTCLKTALAGAAGGFFAAATYPVIVSLLLPAASTEVLLPEEGSTRLLWLAWLSGVIGLAIPIAGRQRRSSSPAKNVSMQTTT